jgi:coenzyme F420-reducing hydrogenase alpha subunit
MKKNCNNICDILVGRHVHPISAIVGGFTKLPKEKDLDTMLDILKSMQPDMDATIELLATLKFPDFQRPTEYVALVNDTDEYPLLSGEIGSTDGLKLNKKDYLKLTNEFMVPLSSAKHTKASRSSYMVGALARLNLNFNKLNLKAKKAADLLQFKPVCTNPYLNTVAQAIESVHCLEESITLIEHFKANGLKQEEAIVVGLNEKGTIPVRAGKGVGAVEVPRGILFHDYEIDKDGKIINANCIIPTGQNLGNVEDDMRKLVPEILDKSDEEITLMMEMLVRAYDPCISCSTHFLDVKFTNR